MLTPSFVRNTSLACDGTFYVSAGHEPNIPGSRNGWKYNGTPGSWSKILPYMGQAGDFGAGANTGGVFVNDMMTLAFAGTMNYMSTARL